MSNKHYLLWHIQIQLELNGKGGDMKNPTCEGMEGEKTRSLPQSISTYNTLNRYLNFFISTFQSIN